MKEQLLYILALVLLNVGLLFVPTGFERDLPPHIAQEKVRVVETNDDSLEPVGVIRTGAQRLMVEVLSGEHAGEHVAAINRMVGKLEFDKVFRPGDTAFASLKNHDGRIRAAIIHDYYRADTELVLFGLFFLLVVGIAGLTGLRAVLTFVFTGLFLWRVLLPAFLRGWDPIPTALGATALLSLVIIFAIAGFNKKGTVAFLGAISGVRHSSR